MKTLLIIVAVIFLVLILASMSVAIFYAISIFKKTAKQQNSKTAKQQNSKKSLINHKSRLKIVLQNITKDQNEDLYLHHRYQAVQVDQAAQTINICMTQ